MDENESIWVKRRKTASSVSDPIQTEEDDMSCPHIKTEIKTEQEELLGMPMGGYLCPICTKHFFMVDYFVKHVKEHHSKEKDHPAGEISCPHVNTEIKIEQEELLGKCGGYHCPICTKHFSMVDNFEKHVNDHHSKEKDHPAGDQHKTSQCSLDSTLPSVSLKIKDIRVLPGSIVLCSQVSLFPQSPPSRLAPITPSNNASSSVSTVLGSQFQVSQSQSAAVNSNVHDQGPLMIVLKKNADVTRCRLVCISQEVSLGEVIRESADVYLCVKLEDNTTIEVTGVAKHCFFLMSVLADDTSLRDLLESIWASSQSPEPVVLTIRSRRPPGKSVTFGKQMKLLIKDRKQIPPSLLTKAMKKNFRANKELFERVIGPNAVKCIVNPVTVVCPVCAKQIILSDTGLLLDYFRHLRNSARSDGAHKILLSCLQREEVFPGPIKSFDASSLPYSTYDL